MQYRKERKKLLNMFVILGLACFLLVNFGHWITYKPLISRIDRCYDRTIKSEPVDFITTILHNARQKEVLMLKLEGPDEGIPIISENLEEEEKFVQLISQSAACYISKTQNSYTLYLNCGTSKTGQITLANLSKKGWLGGLKYALIGCFIFILLGFVMSQKMSDEKIQQIWS